MKVVNFATRLLSTARGSGRARCTPRQQVNSRHLSTTSTLKAVVNCDLEDIEIPSRTISEHCFSREEEFGNNLALVDGVSGDGLTLSEVHSVARCFGSGLLRLGGQVGDVVAIVMPNSPEYVIVFMGAAEAGFVITTLNPIYTSGEIRGQLANSETKFVVTTPALLPKVKEAVADSDVKIIVSGDMEDPTCYSLQTLTKDQGDLIQGIKRSPSDLLVLPYSSGTTGVPKGVMLTHENLVANCAQLTHPKLKLIEEGEVTVCVLPMFHIFAMNVTMTNFLSHGCKLVTIPMFEPKMFLDMILKYRPTALHLAPPLVGFLSSHPMVTADHLSSLNKILVGAAPAGKTLIDLFHKRAPHVRFREGYGMTELSPAATFTRIDTDDSATEGSTGKLVPNTKMKVLDLSTGEEKGPGETGELCFSGPQVMPGYFKNSTATEETIIDGWCHSGDIGYYDEDGNTFVVDRKKELIKVKGLQVAPAELENLIRSMDSVSDVAVIGVPDERAGEVPRAFIVRNNDSLEAAHVQEFVASNLSKHKHLVGGVEFISAIPKSAAGKILRKDLKAQL